MRNSIIGIFIVILTVFWKGCQKSRYEAGCIEWSSATLHEIPVIIPDRKVPLRLFMYSEQIFDSSCLIKMTIENIGDKPFSFDYLDNGRPISTTNLENGNKSMIYEGTIKDFPVKGPTTNMLFYSNGGAKIEIEVSSDCIEGVSRLYFSTGGAY